MTIREQQLQHSSATPDVRFAGFGERFVAYVIDTVFLTFVLVVLGLFVTRGTLTALVALMSVGVIYTIGFWMLVGATPGKLLMNLEVVRTDGGEIGIMTGVLRYIGYTISSIPVGLGFLWIIWDGKKQALHDKIASTVVIKRR